MTISCVFIGGVAMTVHHIDNTTIMMSFQQETYFWKKVTYEVLSEY